MIHIKSKLPTAFVIVDAEGTQLKIPKSVHGHYSNATTLVVTEVSAVLVRDGHIEDGFSYRIHYDIRDLYEENQKTLRYIKIHYPNTFQGRLTCTHKSAISPHEGRRRVFELAARALGDSEHASDDKLISVLFAKGNRLESTWLLYPNSCDGFFERLPPHHRMRCICEIEKYVPKYDSIQNKYEIINKYIKIIDKANVSQQHILNVKDVHLHYSLYECIVFAHVIITTV